MRLEQRGCDSTLAKRWVCGKPHRWRKARVQPTRRRQEGSKRYGSQRAGRGRNTKPLPDAAAPPQPNPRGAPPHPGLPLLLSRP